MHGNYNYSGGQNPIFLSKKLESLESKDVKDIDFLQLYNKFDKTVYGICLRPFSEFNKIIYKSELSYHERKTLEESYMIFKLPFNIIRNDKIKNNLLLLNGKFLNSINPLKYDLEEYNLCLLFEGIKYDKMRYKFANQFTYSKKIDDFFEIFIFNKRYDFKLNYHLKKNALDILREIKGYNFWGILKNTNLNQTISFLNRKIDFTNIDKLKNKEVKDIIEDIRNVKAEENDYLGYMYKSFHDLSSAIRSRGYKLYKIDNTAFNFSNEVFDTFIDKYIDKDEIDFKIDILKILLVNKDLCHLVLKSKYIKMLDFNKYNVAFRYAFLTMKLEDCIMKSNTKYDNRHMFTLEQAHRLPSWLSRPEKIIYNPYFTFLVSNEVLDIKNNFLPVEFDGLLVNMEEYKRRFCIFLTGNPYKDPFKGFKLWERFAVTGSINFAIIPRFNGILCRYYFNPKVKENKYPNLSLRDFLDICLKEYYCNSIQYSESDVDIMNNNETWLGYFNDIKELKNQIDINTSKKSDLVFCKTGAIIVNLNFLKNYILNEGEFNTIVSNDVMSSIQKRCNETPDIKNKIYDYYLKYQILENEKYINNKIFKEKFYNSLFDIIDIDKIFILIKRSDEDWVEYFKSIKKNTEPPKYNKIYVKSFEFDKPNCICDININIKVRLKNPELVKPLEIFRTYNNFCGVVNRFHVDGVRSLYRGPYNGKKETVIMHPTAIASCKTGVVQYPKYFAGKRDYIEVANNYHRRGMGVLFNSTEKIHLLDYSFKVNKWKNAYFKDLTHQHISVDTRVKHMLGNPYKKIIFCPFKDGKYIEPFWYKTNLFRYKYRQWWDNAVRIIFPEDKIPQEPQDISIIDEKGYLKKMILK